MTLLNEKKIGSRWLSIQVGWLEGFGFSRASNAWLIHPLPFLTITVEW